MDKMTTSIKKKWDKQPITRMASPKLRQLPFDENNRNGVMTEKQLYRWLKDKIKSCDWQPIESTTGAGIPDLNYCLQGSEGWIESKTIEMPVRASTKINLELRPSQIAWLYRRFITHHGNCYIFIVVGDWLIVLDPQFAISLMEDKRPFEIIRRGALYAHQRPWPVEPIKTLLIDGY